MLQPWYDGFNGQIVRIGPHSFKLRGFAEYFEPEKKVAGCELRGVGQWGLWFRGVGFRGFGFGLWLRAQDSLSTSSCAGETVQMASSSSDLLSPAQGAPGLATPKLNPKPETLNPKH